MGIELLNVRLGVDLGSLPQAKAVAQLLRDQLGMRRSSAAGQRLLVA